jgi:hypothetical protein
MKFAADVCVGKSSAMEIGRLERCRSSELPKERSPAFRRFAMRMSEIKRAVLR